MPKFKVFTQEVIEREVIFEVEAPSEENARLQAEHNAAFLTAVGQATKGRAHLVSHKVTGCAEVRG